jgi:hypothetical protein
MIAGKKLCSRSGRIALVAGALAAVLCPLVHANDPPQGVVNCANLIYGESKSSVCFSAGFLTQIAKSTNIETKKEFVPVKLESVEMYQHPFAVMTGEGSFQLTESQRVNLRNYLVGGGFLVASAGCSSPEWGSSFRREIGRTFPDLKLTKLELSHPIFHTVYDIDRLDLTKSRGQTGLEGLTIDGKIVLVFSADGLNDTHHAGGNCCCCGGNEIRNSRQINVNLLAYALTH